ncbi:MAG: ABC-F family ATP-binding cassette domain-containing protein [Planctomycetota bacterium]|jgi:ATP-binding cassette subfamily F protein 3
MSLLTLANVHLAFGAHVVLDKVTLSIESGQKIGLIGRNGSGKTTLMRVMLGEAAPDAGTVQTARGARVGYLRQDPDFDPDESVRDAAEAAFAELHRLHRKLDEVYDRMASAGGDELAKLMKRHARLEARFENAGGYAVGHRIEGSLHGLGFTDEQMALKTQALSGGQLSRLGLARLLLEEPDLLLLDEPTNHLDIDGRRWLERFLADEYRGAVVLVSHDRWLLDRVVTRIVEVERAALREYPGNYHKYHELRRQRLVTEHRTYEKQLDVIRREEEYIRRYRAGQRSKQARGREARLERYKRDEMIDRPAHLDVMSLNLPKAARSGDMVIDAREISKRYGDLVLFDGLSVSVGRGDRIGVIGPNGVGKTTLVRCLLGELAPDDGAVRQGSRVHPGHYRQRQDDLDLSLPVWRYLQGVIVSLDGRAAASEQQARDLAGAFLFSGDEQDKPLGDLSGGERSRTVLAGLVAGAHNLLVLDEPTNHLDIPSAERLEAALTEYDGTLILVTHDRALLEATCMQLLVFDGSGSVRLFHGRYSEWAEGSQDQDATEQRAPERAAKRRRARPRDTGGKEPSGPRISFADLEQRIETIERRIGQIDQELLDPAVYTDGARCNALQAERGALAEDLAPLEAEWARRAEQA